MTDNERNFIIELELLSRKCGIAICSEYLYPLMKSELHEEAGYVYLNDNLFWTSKENPWWNDDGDGWCHEGKVIGKEKN
jgi:hypothetical protein